MKIHAKDFRVRPGEKVSLRKWPTRVKPICASKQQYHELLGAHVDGLSSLQRLLYASSRYALLLIVQGMDAAGKDGAIRHVMSGVNPQGCEVFSFKQPSAEELKHDFLWRTTRCLPERGRIGIFNRSYYAEVLIVRVHPEILRGQGDMQSTVAALLASGKGILAADESIPTIEERFTAVNIVSTEETRRAYREMLFTTPRLGACISGAILFDETIRQQTTDGRPMAEVLAKQGVIPGIKVDKHTSPLAAFAGEQITEGLDGLRDRLIEYGELGARFTKWRAVIAIGEHLPTRTCIEVNARALALFAALSQEAGLAPIVEPEVLMDGSHTIARCEEVATTTLQRVFVALCEHRVTLEDDAPQDRHDRVWRGLSTASRRGDRGRDDRALSASRRARGRAGHRVSVGRARRRHRHRETERHLPRRPRSLGAEFLVRTRAADAGAHGLEGIVQQHRDGASGTSPSRAVQQRRRSRHILRADGAREHMTRRRQEDQ